MTEQAEASAAPAAAAQERRATIPAAPAVVALTLAAGVVALGGWLTLWALGRRAAAIWAPLAAGGLWLVFAGSLLALRPWRSRPLTRWPALWLASRAGCFLGVLALAAGLLYSAPHADRLVVGLLLLIGYALLYVAESVALARGVAGWGAQQSARQVSARAEPHNNDCTTDSHAAAGR